MAGLVRKNSTDDGYIPFSVRFKAWWEGIEAEEIAGDGRPASSHAIEVDAPDEEDDRAWPETRLTFCRRLWENAETDEVVEPGGAEYTTWLMKPMSLNAEVSAVDLSAGLGGGVRHTCKEVGTYIDGYELDPELAEEGNRLSKKHGMERRAPILHYTPEMLELPARKFMGALCRERLFQFDKKEQFLETLFNSLRPRGHMVLTDFVVVNAADEDDPAVQAWLAKAPETTRLWKADECRKMLISLGMDIRICEDETNEYRTILLQGWARFVEGLKKPDLQREFINDMMREAEYWLVLIRALESGKLRYVRIHAIRGMEIAL